MDWKNRGGLFKRPSADDDYESSGQVVKAKPLPEKIAKKLGSLAGGKTFVTASSRSQQDFYGNQEIKSEQPSSSSTRLMTQDEKNKFNAKLIKAEMMGDKKLIKKLKKRLEEGTVSDGEGEANEDSDRGRDIMITTTDKRSGVTKPYMKQNESSFETEKDLRQIIEEERNITAEDQLLMYNRLAHRTANDKKEDDWTIDDNMISKQETDKKHKKKKEKKDRKREESDKAFAIKEESMECRRFE